jgi:hypothetical protein
MHPELLLERARAAGEAADAESMIDADADGPCPSCGSYEYEEAERSAGPLPASVKIGQSSKVGSMIQRPLPRSLA